MTTEGTGSIGFAHERFLIRDGHPLEASSLTLDELQMTIQDNDRAIRAHLFELQERALLPRHMLRLGSPPLYIARLALQGEEHLAFRDSDTLRHHRLLTSYEQLDASVEPYWFAVGRTGYLPVVSDVHIETGRHSRLQDFAGVWLGIVSRTPLE